MAGGTDLHDRDAGVPGGVAPAPAGEPDAASCADERAWLVRLCGRITGSADAAEDLAHEVLLRAHRAARAPAARGAWLAGVARHVCADWIRGRQRERRALAALGAGPGGAAGLAWDGPDRTGDLGAEVERGDLLDLLDRALGAVPADTRALLVAHHVDELPVSEAGARLGLSAGAAAMRLHRGRAALRRALLTTFRPDAVAFGLARPPDQNGDHPVPTRMWCEQCGQRRLLGRYAPEQGLYLRCPDCTRGPAVYTNVGWGEPIFGRSAAQFFGGVQGFKAAANRLRTAVHGAYRGGIAGRLEACRHCGRHVPLRIAWYGQRHHGDIQTLCWHGPFCAGLVGTGAVAGSTPEFAAFARRNPRLRAVGARRIETAGVGAIVFSYESRTSRERIELVYARDALVRLAVHGTGA